MYPAEHIAPPSKRALSGAVLLVSTQRTSTTAQLAEAAIARGMSVLELTGPEVLTGLADRDVSWYGGPIAASRAVTALRIGLLEPLDDWLPRLPHRHVGRAITLATLSDARQLTRPAFVKPPREKSFPAGVYPDGTRLPRTGEGLNPDTPVLISDVVTFTVEYRLFLLDGAIATGSRYAVHGRLDPAPLDGDPNERAVREFVTDLLCPSPTTAPIESTPGADALPSAVVLDVGLIEDPDTGSRQWAVVEANMPWFAHCYAADPDRVLDVVLRSAGPLHRIAVRDVEFLRPAETPVPRS